MRKGGLRKVYRPTLGTRNAEPKFGLFGGSFDPVHKGHLALARAALRELKLDRVYFVPARKSPLKTDSPSASARDRLTMLRRALRGEPRFKIEDWELRRPGPSYTYKTLRSFRRRFPGAQWHLLVGGDSLKFFTRWRRWEELLERGRLAAGLRRGVGLGPVPASVRSRVRFLKARLPRASSSEIRERLRRGRSVRSFVPAVVARHIRNAGLYR